MKFTALDIPDVIVIEPRVFSDSRGYFFESYRKDLFIQHGITESFVQDNNSFSALGVLRGLHYQIPPKAQAKLVRVLQGRIFDVVVDIRRNSPTFGRHVAVTLSSSEKKMIFVPIGFAHGFLALEEGTEVLYKVSQEYSPEHERGILWSDATLGILWPKLQVPISLSPKDRHYPVLHDAFLFA
jgi:dTDP-4-dehydrorhamnose 3,5-epimerase